MQRVDSNITSNVYNNTAGPQLRLITCSGAFDSGADPHDRQSSAPGSRDTGRIEPDRHAAVLETIAAPAFEASPRTVQPLADDAGSRNP
jgi:hypothetical protein